LRDQTAPWRPAILYETDTSNFDPIDPERLMTSSDESSDDDETGNGNGGKGGAGGNSRKKKHSKDYHGFYEFTFRRFFDDGGHPLRTGHRVYATDDSANAAGSSSASGANGSQQQQSDAPPPPPDPVYV